MIERLARRKGVRGQFHFASEAKRRIPERDDFVAAKSHRGLHLLGRGEQALALPLGALRVLRFQARPAVVLGLPAELARLTSGKASHELVLRAYE
jgi:hypothetical protein